MSGKVIPVTVDQLPQWTGAQRKLNRIQQQLLSETGYPHDLQKLNAALQRVFEGNFGEVVTVTRSKPELVHGLYLPVSYQIENLLRWNRQEKMGFEPIQITELEQAAPKEWPSEKHVCISLVAYPHCREKQTPEQTAFEVYTSIFGRRFKNYWQWDQISTDGKHLRYLPGSEVPAGTLRVEVIDLNAHWNAEKGMKPADKVGKGSAHFGVLAAAAHHKKWAQSIDGTNVPLPTLGGLQLTVPGRAAWARLPYLDWYRDDRQLKLYAYYASRRLDFWSVPSFRE